MKSFPGVKRPFHFRNS